MFSEENTRGHPWPGAADGRHQVVEFTFVGQ